MLYCCCCIFLLSRCETRYIDSCWFFIFCWIHCNRVVPDKNIPFLNRCFCIFCFLFWFYTIHSFGAMYNFCIDVLYFFFWIFCIFWFYKQLFTVHFILNFVSSMYKYLQLFFFWMVFSSIYTFCYIHFVYLQFFYLQLCQAAGAIKRIPGM